MRSNHMNLAIASGLAFGAFGAVPAEAQEVIDGGQTVSVPGTQASPWNIGSTLTIGSSGEGTLDIANGGVVTNTDGQIGVNQGASGTVRVTGPGATWTNGSSLFVGYGGGGMLTISGGGTVSSTLSTFIGRSATGTGAVTVNGAGSALTSTNGGIFVGYGGAGALDILTGGVATSRTATIGHSTTGSGEVRISGQGSRWAIAPTSATILGLSIGNAGTGRLMISDGGSLSNAGVAHIGSAAGSSGTVVVDGGSWTDQGLSVGQYGTGVLAVTGGGTVSSRYGHIGRQAGSTGTVTVSGAGSSWTTNTGNLFIGSAGTGELTVSGGGMVSTATGYVGYEGTGVLTVADGGAVNAVDGFIGYLVGSSGTAIVRAGGSWSNQSLFVGFFGTGLLTVDSGGTVTSSSSAYIGGVGGISGTVTVDGGSWTDGGLFVGHDGLGELTVSGGGTVSSLYGQIGRQRGSTGTVTVSGAGSSWTTRTNAAATGLYIGNGGTGALTVSDGGTVTTAGAVLGYAADASGTLTIGNGGTWTDEGIVVGHGGAGTLAISAGGTASSAYGHIGREVGSTGVVTVSGAVASWTIGTNAASIGLLVGDAGNGSLAIGDGGLVTAAGGVMVAAASGSAGTVDISNGGTLEAFALAAGTGDAQAHFDGGKLLALGDNAGFITGFAGTTLEIAGGGLTLDTAQYTVATDASGFSGTGALVKSGSGTLILAGANSYVGGTTINQGTLQVGDGGTSGSIVGDVTAGGALVFNRSDTLAFHGAISGTGTLTQAGSGTLTLTGNSSGFGGTTSVAAGTLMADGSLGGTVTGASGASLGGIGTVGGTATIASGGVLIGRQGETLSFGSDLVLASGAIVDVSLGTPGAPGLFDVAGNLTLDGRLDITDLGGFGPGLYRLFDYAGTLTDNGLAIGTPPAGTDASDLFVQTLVARQVNLVNSSGVTLNYWDGGDTNLHNNGMIDGGDGVWNRANPNWTDSGGVFSAPWENGGFAIFTGRAGSVTMDASLGALTISGAQFATDGYRIQGGAITLALPRTTLRVGFGSRSGAGVTATIASELTGSGGLEKTDFGTLILTGANSYAGGTFIDEGTLQLGDGGTRGSILGDVVNHGTFAVDRSDSFTFAGAISGTGGFRQAGTGTTILTGDSSYTGGTTIAAGMLQIGNGGATGSIVGDVANNAALAFNRSGTLALGGAISGIGTVTQAGAGTTTLTGENSYTGGTTIAAGALQIGNGGTTGSVAGDIANNAALVFNRSDVLTFGGAISGTGNVTQAGTGTTILTGTSSHSGGTTIAAGTLQLGDGGTTGSITGDVVNNGALAFRRSDLYSFAGTIGGTGSVVQAGTGTTVFTAANSYSGGTLIEGGTLSVASDANLGAAAGGLTLDGGKLRNSVAFISARAVTLADGGGTFQTDADLTLSGGAAGSGALTKTGSGTLILTGANSYGGGTVIAAGTLQLGNGGAGGSIIGDVANGGALAFNRSDALRFAGAISGSGSLIQRGTGTTILAGINSYAGATRVEAGSLVLAAPSAVTPGPVSIAAGATYALDFSSDPASILFESSLSGAGLMRVDLGDAASFLVFGSNVGSAFTGTVALGRSSFDLGDDNTAALVNAMLRLDAGNTTRVDTGTQAIGNLTLNGGALVLPAEVPSDTLSSGIIQTGTLTLTGGAVAVTVPQPANVPSAGLTSASLLQQDDTVTARLIQAGTVAGSASSLTLVDQNGNTLDQTDLDIAQDGNVVAIGSYGYNLTSGAANDGLYVAYGLSRLDLQPGQTLSLSGDDGTAPGSELHALVTGGGNLAIAATEAITVGNAANAYTGTTRVLTGTLALGTDHALGLTSLLAIDAGATADINGRTQTLGALDVRGALALDGGNLIVANGGTATGTLTGGGSLNLAGGTLAIHGANAQLRANIAIASGAAVLLTDTQGLGTGAIADAGVLTLDGASGTFANALSGAGIFALTHATSVKLGGDNSGFSGVFAIAQDAILTAGLPQHLGGSAIQDDGRLVIDTDTNWALANRVTGTGSLIKQGSGTLTIATNETYSGGTIVSEGTLVVGTPGSTDAALSGGGDTYVAPGATLGGYGRVHGTVINEGTIAVRDALAAFSGQAKGAFTINSGLVNNALAQIGSSGTGNRLIVSNYAGGIGSIVAINAELGDDGSPSDMLVIDGGTASGHSGLRITNVGGDGALTTGDGIRVVDAINGATTAASTFGLVSPVVAGPYEYSLHHGGLTAQGENWYLRSALDCSLAPDSLPCLSTDEEEAPDYRREDSLYAALPSLTLLYGSELIATLHERSGMHAPLSGSAGPAIWGRVIGAREKHDGDPLGIYGSGPGFDYDSVVYQAGIDYHRGEHDRLGVYFAYGRLGGNVTHYTGGFAGDAHLKAYTIGHYWTHVGASGWYVDGVVQGTRYDLEASSHRGLADLETDGHGFAASLESGAPIRLGSGWSLEPQAQIVVQRVSLDAAGDSVSTVRFRDVRSLAGRIGLRLSHDFAADPDAAEPDSGRGTWWLRADLWNEFENDPVTRFSSEDGPVDLDNDLGGLQLKLTTAVSAEVAKGIDLFASGNVRHRLDGDSFGYQGSMGLKIAF